MTIAFILISEDKNCRKSLKATVVLPNTYKTCELCMHTFTEAFFMAFNENEQILDKGEAVLVISFLIRSLISIFLVTSCIL